MKPRFRPAAALAARLDELARVIAGIDDRRYLAAPHAVSGSIGAHVRHAIDHVTALVDACRPGTIDYDTRGRGTAVERDRWAAIAELRRLIAELRLWSAPDEHVAVDVSAVVDPTGARVVAPSTTGRELVFVLSHTIHHQAIIALLLAADGIATPERFSLAPSTPARSTCARSA